MKTNWLVVAVLVLLLGNQWAYADLKHHPIRFALSTEKESYYEGEKITFYLTITNTDTGQAHPVLLPHTQNVGQKLFCLSAYDKATNTQLLRYTENPQLQMRVQDTGSVQIRYLQPLEQLVVPIYLNDFADSAYHIQTASHHSFGVPLFAGIYQVRLAYQPNGIALGDSLYNYYYHSNAVLPPNGKLAQPSNGSWSNFCTLNIKRSADSTVTIEGKKYYVSTDGYLYFYHSRYTPKISTDTSCHHITNLPPDSFSRPREYFYSYYYDRFAEYVARFDDGDIREYRKFSDWCPSDLYTEQYNEHKQKTKYALQLPDKRFYSVTYHQPSGSINEESYCSSNGTRCTVTQYVYNKQGGFVRKKVTETEPCSEILIDGKLRSATNVMNLEGR